MKNHWPGSRLACLTIVLSAALATVWAGTGALPLASAPATAISAVHVAQSGHETTVRVESGAPLVYRQIFQTRALRRPRTKSRARSNRFAEFAWANPKATPFAW
jgi:hypothetical protein